jgi:hypothetical protein
VALNAGYSVCPHLLPLPEGVEPVELGGERRGVAPLPALGARAGQRGEAGRVPLLPAPGRLPLRRRVGAVARGQVGAAIGAAAAGVDGRRRGRAQRHRIAADRARQPFHRAGAAGQRPPQAPDRPPVAAEAAGEATVDSSGGASRMAASSQSVKARGLGSSVMAAHGARGLAGRAKVGTDTPHFAPRSASVNAFARPRRIR